MDNITAENIGKKSRALKHCNKVIAEIDKKGSATITLNCTGVIFTVHKNDAIYLQLQATRAQLIQEIGSYEIVRKASKPSLSKRFAPAPVGSSIALTDAEMAALEEQRARNNAKSREWYQKNRERKLAYNREYYAKRREQKE